MTTRVALYWDSGAELLGLRPWRLKTKLLKKTVLTPSKVFNSSLLLLPFWATSIAMRAFPAQMHCTFGGHRESPSSAANFTLSPSPGRVAVSPTLRLNGCPRVKGLPET